MENRGDIFDPLRKKRVALTPEEQVRQFFIGWLNKERGFPLSLMASEYSICYNKQRFRCDIVCFNKSLEPQMIIECKAPDVKLTNAVLEQIARYNLVLRVKYLVITNGHETYVCRYNCAESGYSFIGEIPFYSQLDTIDNR